MMLFSLGFALGWAITSAWLYFMMKRGSPDWAFLIGTLVFAILDKPIAAGGFAAIAAIGLVDRLMAKKG